MIKLFAFQHLHIHKITNSSIISYSHRDNCTWLMSPCSLSLTSLAFRAGESVLAMTSDTITKSVQNSLIIHPELLVHFSSRVIFPSDAVSLKPKFFFFSASLLCGSISSLQADQVSTSLISSYKSLVDTKSASDTHFALFNPLPPKAFQSLFFNNYNMCQTFQFVTKKRGDKNILDLSQNPTPTVQRNLLTVSLTQIPTSLTYTKTLVTA